MKSEPAVYSIDHLASDKTTHWDGVRNFQARNFLRDSMQVGDQIIFYHSNAHPPAAVGVAYVSKAGYPDFTAWDPQDPHFDPKSNADNPTWYMVDISFAKKFTHALSLDDMKQIPELSGLMVIQKGARLSIQPVSKEHFETLVRLGS